jgi:hypothetical protein
VDRDEHVTEVRSWGEGTCQDCGLPFPRRHHYERRCPFCYKLDKSYNVLWGDQAFLWAQEQVLALQLELRDTQKKLEEASGKHKPKPPPSGLKGDLLRQVIALCHPDKHGNSERATKVTQALLKLRVAQPKKKRRRKT